MTRAVQQGDFWQRRSARRVPPPPERRLHIAVVDTLRLCCRPGWWFSHIPSGEYRTAPTGALLLRLGLRPGMFDLLFVGPDGQHYWMELKRDQRAPLTEGQKHFAEMLRQCGVPHHVARSYDDAIAQLKTWGVL